MLMAVTIGKRSLCRRDQVGAVIVDRHNRIIDTGYNGPPAGLNREGSCVTWCPRGTIGTMLGYKHEPDCAIRTTHHLTCTCGAYSREQDPPAADYSDCPALHAEQNALMFGDRTAREGGTIYVSSSICGTCAKLVANSGLTRVVMLNPADKRKLRSIDKWVGFMTDCGLKVVTI